MVLGQQPWQVLSVLPAWQVTQIPRPAQRRDGARTDGGFLDDGTVQRAAELVSAYCRSAPVAVAWVRERAGGPVRVITAGLKSLADCPVPPGQLRPGDWHSARVESRDSQPGITLRPVGIAAPLRRLAHGMSPPFMSRLTVC
jgi:hypothetical protein